MLFMGFSLARNDVRSNSFPKSLRCAERFNMEVALTASPLGEVRCVAIPTPKYLSSISLKDFRRLPCRAVTMVVYSRRRTTSRLDGGDRNRSRPQLATRAR